MKKFIIIFLMLVLSVMVSACRHSDETSSPMTEDLCAVENHLQGSEIITAKVIRVGRYIDRWQTPYLSGGTGTILLFENGDVFRGMDDDESSFACALKEGDLVTYEKKGERIVLKKLIVSQN